MQRYGKLLGVTILDSSDGVVHAVIASRHAGEWHPRCNDKALFVSYQRQDNDTGVTCFKCLTKS